MPAPHRSGEVAQGPRHGEAGGDELPARSGDGSFEEAIVVDIEETEGYAVGRAGDFDGDGVIDLLGGRVVAEPALTELVVARGPWPTLSFDVIAVLDRSGAITYGDGVSDLLMTDASLTPLYGEPKRTYFFALVSSP